MMKTLFGKAISLLLAALTVLALLAGCQTGSETSPSATGVPPQETPTVSGTGETPAAPGRENSSVRLADIQSGWVWALSNGESETPGDRLVAVSYAAPGDWESRTLAVGSGGVFPVGYAGEKEADGRNGDYYLTFDGVPGPSWRVAEGSLPVGQDDYLLLPASCQSGLLAFTPVKEDPAERAGFDNHGHPAADPADVATMEALKKGRVVMHSELLATDADGGRVALFQFENTDYGLLILAYLRGDLVIVREFIGSVWADGVGWRADMEPDDAALFEVAMLCQTAEGLTIGFLWYGAEGVNRYLLAENGGHFTDFVSESWYYDRWEDSVQQTVYELSNAELWPELTAAALVGTWTGAWDTTDWASVAEDEDLITFTFRPDGTGQAQWFGRAYPITYALDGNLLICKWVNDWSGEEAIPNTDVYRAKAERNRLTLDGYPVLARAE
ncbi:MAG: hypothetical protein LBT60_07645 [Oscillospiraceae bacterium]|jgi:hypothetical protein|nr:hypothetical protein [Oscillospiraceae bacterium]